MQHVSAGAAVNRTCSAHHAQPVVTGTEIDGGRIHADRVDARLHQRDQVVAIAHVQHGGFEADQFGEGADCVVASAAFDGGVVHGDQRGGQRQLIVARAQYQGSIVQSGRRPVWQVFDIKLDLIVAFAHVDAHPCQITGNAPQVVLDKIAWR